MNLADFLTYARNRSNVSTGMHLKEPGFQTLYVRYTRRYIAGKMIFPVFDIASVDVRRKGRGTFTRFLQKVLQECPEAVVYVENVLNPRFVKKLESLGFTNLGPEESPCLWLRRGA